MRLMISYFNVKGCLTATQRFYHN